MGFSPDDFYPKGNTGNGFYSTDGSKWTPMSWNPRALNLVGPVYIGLAVTSHVVGVACTVQFSNITVTGASGAWQFAEIGVDHPLNDRGSLYVALKDSANHVAVVTHDGTAAGDPNYIPGPAGYGTAMDFDGDGTQYVALGTFNPSAATGQLTVSLWAKWNGLNNEFQGLIAKRDSFLANDMMWHFETQQTAGVIRVGREGTSQVSSEAMTVGQWEHWAFTFDGSQVVIYRSGRPVANGAFSFGTDVNAAMYLGETSLTTTGTGSNPYNGGLAQCVNRSCI